MASSASFWAQKAEFVKIPVSTSAPAADCASQEVHDLPATNKTMLILTNKKRPGMPAPETPPPFMEKKKLDWADDEDEEELLASPSASIIADLQREAAQKSVQIAELQHEAAGKSSEIAELQREAAEKASQINDLQREAAEKSSQLKELQREVLQLHLELQELKAKSVDKREPVNQVEDHLDAEQELANGESKMTSAVHSATEVQSTTPAKGSSTASNKAPTSDKATACDGSVASSTVVEKTTASPRPETTSPVANSPSSGPTFVDGEAPIFVTQEIVKTVAPAPKAKILSFPIDLSKYGKKPASPVPRVEKKPAPSSPHKVCEPSRDIRTMKLEERTKLGTGPKITVKMGEEVLATIPKLVFMQCSSKAFVYFNKNADATAIILPPNSLDTEAAKIHLTWLNEMTFQHRVYSVNLNVDRKPQTDIKNLNICQAARVLGLHNMYVGHYTKHLCQGIRTREVSIEVMDAVCALAYAENDPVFDCLAHNLFHEQQRRKLAPELQGLIAKHGNLAVKLEDIKKCAALKNGPKNVKA